MERRRKLGSVTARDRLLAAFVALLWGINFLALDYALRWFPPLFFAGLRFLVIAVPTVLLVPLPGVKWRWLLGYGLGFGTVQFAFLFLAMDAGLPTGLASLVLQASAPFTVLLGGLLLRERIRPVQVAGIAIAVLGMAAIGWHRAQSAALLPVLLALCGALGWALGNLCSRQAQAPNPLRLTLWMSIVPPVPMFALSAFLEGPGTCRRASVGSVLSSAGWAALGGLAFTSLLATVVGSGLWTTLLARYPASTVAPFSLLVPIVGVTSAWLVLGERPHPVELAAGVVVVAGVLLGSRPPRTTPPPLEPVAPPAEAAPVAGEHRNA